MESKDALRVLAELTSYQWGMVTSAQASMQGITRLDLSRLAKAGHLKRLSHGVYMHSGTPGNQFDTLRAAWLSTEPKLMGETRIKDRANGVVVAGPSAARLHGIGDLWADRHEFVTPQRRQSQRFEIRYRQRSLDAQDVVLVEGLPAMTIERTISDLVEEVGDLSLVADALRDASLKRNLDVPRLQDLLAPFAKRNNLKHGDGSALLNRLLEIAGIDWDTVARRVAADTSLGSRVAASYLDHLSTIDLGQLVTTPEMQRTMCSLQESITAMLQAALAPITESMRANVVQSSGVDDVAKRIAEQFATSDAMQQLSQAWVKSLKEGHVFNPDTLTSIRGAQRTIVND
jgi:hypothetical protein